MRPYIFLDCDGVVNGYIQAWSSDHLKAEWDKNPVYCTYPWCLDELQALCRAVNPIVVISSTWRILNDRAYFVERFGTWFEDYLAEGDDWKTPGGGGERGPQIAQWLQGREPRPYVVLDDETSDLFPDQPVVKTGMLVGLEAHDRLRAIALLRLQGWQEES